VQIVLDDLQFTVRQVQVEIGPLILSCNDSAHVIANSASIHQLAAFGDTGAGARVTSPDAGEPCRCDAVPAASPTFADARDELGSIGPSDG
jgi:hypothetical protein